MKFKISSLKERPKFSLIILLLFTAAFVITGAYFIFHSFGAPAIGDFIR